MKLYELPAGAKFKIMGSNEVVYKYFNTVTDLPYCLNQKDEVVHILPITEVELIKE